MRLARTGVRPNFRTPGPYALDHFDIEHVLRGVRVCTLAEVADRGGRFPGRAFVEDDRVAATSAYLIGGVTWDAWSLGAAGDGPVLPGTADARAFAQDVAGSVSGALPRGYVLDVGRDTAGRWSVIETNRAWSSNPYWATTDDADGVVATILARHPDSTDGLPWLGEPVLAARARALPVR